MMLSNFENYLKIEKRYSPHTVSGYIKDVEAFNSFLSAASPDTTSAGTDPTLVTSDDIRSWVRQLSSSGLSSASVNRKISSVRAYFRFLRKCGITDSDPLRAVGFLRKESRLPEYVTESNIGDFLSVYDSDIYPPLIRARNTLILYLFYSAGLRLAELLDLKPECFAMDRKELKVIGKGNKERVVPVVDELSRRLTDYMRQIAGNNICQLPGNSLFLTEKGTPMSRSGIYRIVKYASSLAGVTGKGSPHVLRHTFATHLLNNGADIRELQELMGHNSLAATQVYTHNSIAALKQVYKNAHPRGRK